jgi:uncharacterized metal-binding protein YceD (DUF177 family)
MRYKYKKKGRNKLRKQDRNKQKEYERKDKQEEEESDKKLRSKNGKRDKGENVRDKGRTQPISLQFLHAYVNTSLSNPVARSLAAMCRIKSYGAKRNS